MYAVSLFYGRLPFMDKSRQYIEMCRRSKEIQSLWNPKAGDFYKGLTGDVLCYVPGTSKNETIRKGFEIKAGNKVTTLSPLIWLPKLDQLIEAAQIQGCCFRDISFQFYEWVKLPYGNSGTPANKHFTSLEQVWLAFIMNTRFARIWDDEMWQNVPILPSYS